MRAELMAYAPDGVTPRRPALGRSADHAPAALAHLLEKPGRLRPADRAGLDAAAGRERRDIEWPAPRKLPIGALTNYGYEDTLLLPVPLTVAADFKPASLLSGASQIEVKLRASWLVCKEECIPEEGQFALKLPVQGATAVNRADFDSALAARPAALAAGSQATLDGNTLRLRVDGLPAALQGRRLEFFPETPEVLRNNAKAGADWTQAWDGTHWTATLPLAEQRSASPATLPIVLTLADAPAASAAGSAAPTAWRTEASISGNWPAAPPRASVSPALTAALAANAAAGASSGGSSAAAGGASPTLLAALLGALLGGLLLNLMPCVFPILAIKVLGFARQSGDAGGHRRAALAYTAGVLVSFLALGGAMLALRAAGAQLAGVFNCSRRRWWPAWRRCSR